MQLRVVHLSITNDRNTAAQYQLVEAIKEGAVATLANAKSEEYRDTVQDAVLTTPLLPMCSTVPEHHRYKHRNGTLHHLCHRHSGILRLTTQLQARLTCLCRHGCLTVEPHITLLRTSAISLCTHHIKEATMS